MAKIIEEYISLEDSDFQIDEYGQAYSVSVVARQKFHQRQTHPLVQQTQFFVYLKDSLCDHCSRMISGYYEAVLQARRQDHSLTQEERAAITDRVSDLLRENEFISHIKERKEGTDFFFSSIRAAKRVAETLRKEFGGVIKDSYHTVGFSKQKGTDIKRGTILFSLPRYKRGDIVCLQDSLFKVEKACKKLHLKNRTEEKVFPWKKVEYLENHNEIQKLSSSQYESAECQVVDIAPSHILIMRPDFTTLYLEPPKGIKVDIGNSYKILFFRKHAHWM